MDTVRPENKMYFRRTGVAVTALSALALGACGGERDEPRSETSPAASSSSESTIESTPVEPSTTSDEPVCGDELDVVPGRVVVDGRCDTDPIAPVGVYGEPSQDMPAFATAETGDELFAECVVEGESISDLSGTASTEWVRFDFGRSFDQLDIKEGQNVGDGPAFIPGTWVDGDEKLKSCES